MAWWEFIEFPVWVHTYVYHRASELFGAKETPKGGATDIPRTDENSPLPLVYGRCRVRAPALIWIGNWRVNLDTPNSNGYSLDMLFNLGLPFYGGTATLHVIYAGDFLLTLVDSAPDSMTRAGRYRYVSINGGSLYGGEDGNGGIDGDVEFFDGRRDQQLSDYIDDADPSNWTDLQTQMTLAKFTSDSHLANPELLEETLMPGYRNQVVCLLFNWSIGRIPNFTSYGFEVRTLSTGTAADMGQSLADEADPAAVLYDLFTSPFGKLGIPASKIDLPSFQASSLTLYNEGHGYSRAFEDPTDAWEIAADILRQTDGVIYEEPTTGKLVYKLIRFDYDPNNLDDINPDNAERPEPGWYSVRGWSETFNQVRLTFTDRQNNYADGLKIAQNAANVFGQTSRALRSVDIRFPGCCTETLAKELAARELAVVSSPLAKATITVNRNFYQVRPGDAVTLTWPELGINRMIMRVVRVDMGQLHDGRIKLDLLRDVFDVTQGAF